MFMSLVMATLLGQQPPAKPSFPIKEDKPGQLAQAKISADAALATAKAKVVGGTLKNAEIEEEDGALVYVFNFTRAGKKGEEEVLVNAKTGAFVKAEHESAEDEAKEQAEDKAKAAKAAKMPAKPAAKPAKPPVS